MLDLQVFSHKYWADFYLTMVLDQGPVVQNLPAKAAHLYFFTLNENDLM